MDLDGILNICDILGLGYSHPREGTEERGPQISISCPLAPYRHKDRYDSNNGCSVKIVTDGPSLVRCFSGSCGFKGTWLRLLQTALDPKLTPELTQLLEETAKIEELTLQARVARNNKIIERMTQEKTVEEDDKDVFPEAMWEPHANKVPPYALKRGLTLDTCRRWGLGYDERLKRLLFPIRRRDLKLVGMQGRDITGTADRPHHNYEGFNRQKYLLGAHLLEPGKPVIVCEGGTGTVKTDQAMWPTANAVGTLGEGFSKWHADTIAEMNPPCVYICCDGDAPGHAIASKIEYMLHGRIPMRIMECPTDVDDNGKKKWDTGNLPPEHIQYMYKNARPILDRIRWTIPIPSFDGSKWIMGEGSDPASAQWNSSRFCGGCAACPTRSFNLSYMPD